MRGRDLLPGEGTATLGLQLLIRHPSISVVCLAFCSDFWVILLFILDLRFVCFSPSGFSVLILKIALGNRDKKEDRAAGSVLVSAQSTASGVLSEHVCVCMWPVCVASVCDLRVCV